jgi:hypothetical protein
MVTTSQHKRPHSIQIEFSDENATSFAGLALVERAASRLGLWPMLEKVLPERDGQYSWIAIAKSIMAGLLSGARGTFATQDLREDEALLSLLSLSGAPEEATVWRALEGLGELARSGELSEAQERWARAILAKSRRKDLLNLGFFPIFADGTVLEGSRRREGTKYQKDKKPGLVWSTVFAGPVVGAQQLAEEGEGEQACVRRMLPSVVEKVVRPLGLRHKALVLADSLHGDEPTLDLLEGLNVHYIVGANKLKKTEQTLQGVPKGQWLETGEDASRGWSESSVCVCWLQCDSWQKKRTLVGRRWKNEGEMIWNYSGVVTELEKSHVEHLMEAGATYPETIWRLYGSKMGLETFYQDLLSDLGLHHPPCQELVRNAGFYAVATLAHTLAKAVDLIGCQDLRAESASRKDGAKPRRARSRRMRLWSLRRRFFMLPGRIVRHGHMLKITLLGVGETLRRQFEAIFASLSRC